MPKFRKKPVVIEAELASVLIGHAGKNWSALPEWFRKAYDKGGIVITPDGIHIPTLEGTMIARREDMVICGVQNEVYPCKPDIFEATYEAVNP